MLFLLEVNHPVRNVEILAESPLVACVGGWVGPWLVVDVGSCELWK